MIGSGALGAVLWNVLTWWRGLPSSSAHALVGGLVGAALVEGGIGAVQWGGLDGWRPVGVFGVLIALAVSPLIGLALGFVVHRARPAGAPTGDASNARPDRGRRLGHGGGALVQSRGQRWAEVDGRDRCAAARGGQLQTFEVPLWAKVACGAAITLGTVLGGWRIVRTVGRRIFHLAPIDSLASQTGSTAVILPASYLGAPVSTTQVVVSSVVGVGTGRRRWRHVRWTVVRSIAFAWLLTLPGSAVLGAVTFLVWRAIG